MVVPADTAVTTPEEFIVATELLLLVHTPPPSPVLLYCVVAFMQSGDAPVTVPGFGSTLTVNVFDADELVQLFVTE